MLTVIYKSAVKNIIWDDEVIQYNKVFITYNRTALYYKQL